VSVILTVIGLLFLLVSMAGIFFGIYMATDPRTRGQGVLFAVWWVPGLAAASGVLMRDVVTLAVGLLCLLVAGAVLAFEGGRPSKPTARRKNGSSEVTTGGVRQGQDSEKTTKENRSDRYGKAAS
jgi:hypothetical protein